ncbi:MAG: hypothetical protein NT075_14985, partial [Chloroflexi bacterium]|nr:hypothetical protein [Chloroflexota bacterium]
MRTILFLDNWLIERQEGLERVWGKPQFVKELFTDIHPGVLGYGGYYTVFYDEQVGRYVMYLAVYPPEADPGTFVVRLQSDDPYHWPNPVYDLNASTLWQGFQGKEWQDVVVDEQGGRFWPIFIRSLAGTPQAERGYLTTTLNPSRQIKNSLFGFSTDGLHFTLRHDRPWQQTRSDTWCGWLWNQQAGLYQIATRPVHVDRRIATITTRDWEQFTPATTLLQPDAVDRPGTEFYSMPTIPYEDLYIGLVHMFSTDTFETRRVKMNGRMETQLTYSYNGFNWYRSAREPFMPTRPYGLPGGGQLYGMEMVRTRENKLLFFTDAS